MIITTTPQIEGYEITEYLGLVGDLDEVARLEGIIEVLETEAAKLGADAVVGVAIHPAPGGGSGFGGSIDSNCCYAYGTAVRIRKK